MAKYAARYYQWLLFPEVLYDWRSFCRSFPSGCWRACSAARSRSCARDWSSKRRHGDCGADARSGSCGAASPLPTRSVYR